jgi:hypothetical protein
VGIDALNDENARVIIKDLRVAMSSCHLESCKQCDLRRRVIKGLEEEFVKPMGDASHSRVSLDSCVSLERCQSVSKPESNGDCFQCELPMGHDSEWHSISAQTTVGSKLELVWHDGEKARFGGLHFKAHFCNTLCFDGLASEHVTRFGFMPRLENLEMEDLAGWRPRR